MIIEAETLEELRERVLQVFARFDEYGTKVNYEKVKWVSETIQFLGCGISSGYWSHKNSLKKTLAELGRFQTIKNLERIISYARRCVKDVEMILGPLIEGLKTFKSEQLSES